MTKKDTRNKRFTVDLHDVSSSNHFHPDIVGTVNSPNMRAPEYSIGADLLICPLENDTHGLYRSYTESPGFCWQAFGLPVRVHLRLNMLGD